MEKVESLEQAAREFMERSGAGRQTISTTIGKEWSVTHLMAAFAAERERQVWAEAISTLDGVAARFVRPHQQIVELRREFRARGEQVKEP